MRSVPQWYADWRLKVEFDLVGSASGDWQPDWVVIGHETACGDPIFVSGVEPYPVFTAIHGEGDWDQKLVAPSLEAFFQCLTVFRKFAAGRSNPVELDANPPTLEQQARFLKTIGTLAGASPELLNFWAVQIDVDLDTFEHPLDQE